MPLSKTRIGHFKPENSDGCTFIGAAFRLFTSQPHLPFKQCCVAHDEAYWYGGDPAVRDEADLAMRECIRRQGYPVLAYIMWLFVHYLSGPKLFGLFNNPLPWAWRKKVTIVEED
jgi:hypothetical protein